ncbi:MAG: SDR family NAD(P)-dependent oxidoreductase [Elusimicrobiota bacterium]
MEKIILKDKVIVITGASTGIGKELAFEYARRGAKVVLAARSIPLIEENASLIVKSGGEALPIATDISQRDQMESLIKKSWDKFGRVDMLICNAGISPAKGSLLENDEKDIRNTMEVNFMGSVYGIRAVVPYFEKRGEGQIILVTSIIGKRGIPFNSAYCASKFALQGLAESIRPELMVKNIHLMTVCPAGVDTPFYSNNGKSENREYKLHSPEKIARMIVNACEKKERELLPTFDAKLLYWGNVYFPKFMDKMIFKVKKVGGKIK